MLQEGWSPNEDWRGGGRRERERERERRDNIHVLKASELAKAWNIIPTIYALNQETEEST